MRFYKSMVRMTLMAFICNKLIRKLVITTTAEMNRLLSLFTRLKTQSIGTLELISIAT